MQFKYILYLLFLTLFACEHHSKNINIKNKPEDKKTVVQKDKIKVSSDKNEKREIINIVYSNKGFALIYDEDVDNFLESYVYIETINSNNLYVANDVKTFDEEKEVANKAPVDDIMVQSISLETEIKESKTNDFVTNFNYIIKFADFYFEDSAIMLKNRLFEEHKIENILIKKLSQNNFRVYKGPYKDFEKLKKGFHNIENLDFDSIEIIKL